MFIYNHTLTLLETPNNVFVIKMLDDNEQTLQVSKINTNKYNFEKHLNDKEKSVKIIAITPIDEAGNETEPTYKYHLNLTNGNQDIQNENKPDGKYLAIQLNALGLAVSGFTLSCTQNILINIAAYPNKVLEHYMVTINDSNGAILPPKYIYTSKGYPGYTNPKPLEVLLNPGNYTVWVNGKYF
jgi:hypothetical protein